MIHAGKKNYNIIIFILTKKCSKELELVIRIIYPYFSFIEL